MKKRVSITSANGKTFGQTFYDQDEMDAWITKQKDKALKGSGWGLGHSEPVIEDLTSEHESEIAEKEARRTEVQQLKAAFNIIDGWNSMGDIDLVFLKKFFKRIIKEMRD